MEGSTLLLAGTAVTIGFIHTLVGPDHYLPFIVMGEARGMDYKKDNVNNFPLRGGACAELDHVGFHWHRRRNVTLKTRVL